MTVEQLEIRRLFAAGDYAILQKVETFSQTSQSTPTLVTDPYGGYGSFYKAGDTVSSATLTKPDSTVVDLLEAPTTGVWTGGNIYATQADLDAAFPNGAYELTINDSSQEIYHLNLSGSDEFVTAPELTNYDALQSADPSQDLTLDWGALEGTSSDLIKVSVYGALGAKIFSTPNAGAVGALDGTATSVTIPAGTLAAGTTYTCVLSITIPISEDTADYMGVPGFVGFTTDTGFSIVTQSTLGAPTDVAASQGTFPHHTTITWAAVTGAASYQIYRSTVDDFADANKLTGGVTGTAYSDILAAPGVLHYYWVLARDGTDIGPPSAAVSGFTELNAPLGFQATDAAHHVALSWDAALNAASYQIFRGTTSNFSSATRIAAGITTTFFDDTTAVSGTDYFYWVRPKNALGVGAAAGPEEGALS
ncbi:MAG: hypothetical protein ABSG31_10535 [Tepidisphaeraceae bacterium]|jgi:hypothetical protein